MSRTSARAARRALAAAPKRPTPTFGAAMDETPSKNGANETHPWIAADINRIHNAILDALRGQPAQLQDVYDDILDRDDRVSACARTRTLALVGRPWAVKPAPGMEQDAEAKRIAEECHDIMAAIPRWPLVVGELADGILKGFAVQEIMWGVDRKGRYVPKDFRWRAQNRFVWQPLTLELARRDVGDPYWGKALSDVKPDGFVVHTPKAGRAAYAMRGGALISVLVLSLAKKHGNIGWLKGIERMGVPLPVLKISGDQNPGDELIAEGKKILRNMSAHWGAVVWGEMEFVKAGGTGEWNGDAQEKLVALCNTSIAIELLGQNMTTEISGGGFGGGGATTQNIVRGDLLANDLVELDATVRDQVLERIVRFNWPGAPVPVYVTTTGEKAEITVAEVEAGLYTEDEARGRKGYAPKADGAGSKYRPALAAVPAQIGAPAPGVDVPTADVQQAALNGAQVSSLQEILINVATGQLPRETGIKLITAAFPISATDAEAMMGTVGAGFTPAAPADASPGGAPAAPPFRSVPLTVVPTFRRTTP